METLKQGTIIFKTALSLKFSTFLDSKYYTTVVILSLVPFSLLLHKMQIYFKFQFSNFFSFKFFFWELSSIYQALKLSSL